MEGLETLREELERGDEDLLEAIRARIDCCTRIARHRCTNDIAMMQPHRIEAVHAKRFAAGHGLDAGFLETCYHLVIAETCRVDDEVMADGWR